MKGKFLTKNIELTLICIGSHCVYKESLTGRHIMEQKDVPRCPECGSLMKVDEEFIIKN